MTKNCFVAQHAFLFMAILMCLNTVTTNINKMVLETHSTRCQHKLLKLLL